MEHYRKHQNIPMRNNGISECAGLVEGPLPLLRLHIGWFTKLLTPNSIPQHIKMNTHIAIQNLKFLFQSHIFNIQRMEIT